MQAWTPNLIMPGVAKCGTTTLYDLLVTHPEITGGKEKEVRFLMDEGDDLCREANIRSKGLEGWVDEYADGGKGPFKVWLDASPQYQFQQTAFDTIAALNPQPVVVFMFRRPSARLFSLYQYCRYHQGSVPEIESFAQFIDHLRAPTSANFQRQKMLKNGWEDTRFDRCIEKWSGIVAADRLIFTSAEALNADRDAVLAGIAKATGIDPAGFDRDAPRQSNPTVRIKSKWLAKTGGKIARRLPNSGPIRKIKDMAKAYTSGSIDKSEKAENAELLRQLDIEFAPAIAAMQARNLLPQAQ